MQPAGGADDVEAGPDVEVIGVAEDDLRAHLEQFARVERLHAGLGADRHEHRRIHDAMRRGQFSQARPGVRIRFEQFKHRAKSYICSTVSMPSVSKPFLRTCAVKSHNARRLSRMAESALSTGQFS